ncbi:MAG: hypothetical protein ACQERN_13345, partial [Thermodesulfobacteriota bacterium]
MKKIYKTAPNPLRRRCLKAAAIVLLMTHAILAGCASKSPAPPPPIPSPKAFSDAGTEKLPDRWWTVFDDPDLNRLVERALAANFNLKTAWQRLSEARAIAERQSADLFPELEGFAEGETRRAETGDTDSLQLGLAAAYEVDRNPGTGRRNGFEADR